MNITIMTSGTEGDIYPYVALAKGLKARGFEATVVTQLEFEALVREHGLDYRPIRMNFSELMKTEESKAALDGDRKAARKLSREVFCPALESTCRDLWEAVQDSDAIISNHVHYYARHMADKLRIPFLFVTCSPFLSPTRAFPFMFFTTKDLGGPLNRLSYLAVRSLPVKEYPYIAKWYREGPGMSIGSRFGNVLRRKGRPIPVMYYFSPLLLPRPRDWPEDTLMAGYWPLERKAPWEPPEALEAFLSSGPPPVYIGFGSMVTRHRERVSRIVASALKKTGERAVIYAGTGGILDPKMPEQVYYSDFIPHDRLFPKVKAVVHHGGTGTLSQGLKHGKPTVICPVIADQVFWGSVVHKLGVGPPPFKQRFRDLTADLLAEAIRSATTDESMRRKAEKLGEGLRQEDAMGNAVKFVEMQSDKWYKRHGKKK